jgi:hypothetical protein
LQFQTLKTNEAMFDLALKEQISADKLIKIANVFEREKKELKRRVLRNFWRFSKQDFDEICTELNQHRNWTSFNILSRRKAFKSRFSAQMYRILIKPIGLYFRFFR